MSSWFVSLRSVDRRGQRSGRRLKISGLRLPRLLDGLVKIGPGRTLAEPRSQIDQQGCNLAIIHAVAEPGHDRTALARDRLYAGDDGVSKIARIGGADRTRAALGDSAIGQRPPAFMAAFAGRRIDRRTGIAR